MTLAPFSPPSQGYVNVLLVEDEPDDQLLFRLAAQRAYLNLRIQTVDNGQRALDYLQGQPPFADRTLNPFPDLLVLDLLMPLVDGFEVLHRLKTSAAFQHLPVIVWSGSLQATGWKEMATGLQADGCLEKLPRMADLTAALRQLWLTLSPKLCPFPASRELRRAA